MRHLVYRVQALPQSLLPLVWDFGTLKSGSTSDAETKYIRRMIEKFASFNLASCKNPLIHQLKSLPIMSISLLLIFIDTKTG